MTTESKPPVERIDKPGYPPKFKNNGTKEGKPITSKRRLAKMLKGTLQHRGRKHNHVIAERRRKRDLLLRDMMRGHDTPRIRAALRRAAIDTNPENNKE